MSSVPERERRITASYRNLLREYEQLVQRYLKVYKPPTMVSESEFLVVFHDALIKNSVYSILF
jgi:hypothetical protein